MSNIKNRSIAGSLATLATILTIAAATPVRAETTTTTTVPVGYGDIDLSTPAGKATLDRRVRAAINEVCGTPEIGNRLSVAACQRNALIQARQQIAQIQSRQDAVQLAVR